MIHFKATNRKNIFLVFQDEKMICRYNSISEGAILISTDDIFRKYNAFGLLKDLLENDKLKFKYIIISYRQNKFWTTRDTLKKEGIEHDFNFGTKIFLPIRMWKTESNNQLEFDFKEHTENGK